MGIANVPGDKGVGLQSFGRHRQGWRKQTGPRHVEQLGGSWHLQNVILDCWRGREPRPAQPQAERGVCDRSSRAAETFKKNKTSLVRGMFQKIGRTV